MTRKMLEKKEIERLDSIEEAIELVSVLNYGECIMLLHKIASMPKALFDAVVDRAKSFNGITFELLVAMTQNMVNE